MSSIKTWRLLDTGARSAAQNIALDQALLSLRSRDVIPDTVRFLQFSQPAVLVGRHQATAQEIRDDYCRQHGIEVNRRITGGGAIFIDPTQICWEVIAGREGLCGRLMRGGRLADLTELICQAVVTGLARLGVEASFRPRNDIEAGGRKLAGTGGAYEGEAFLFQGTLLMQLELETMFRALRVPTEKLASHELEAAADRVVDLASLLGDPLPPGAIKEAIAWGFEQVLDIELEDGELTGREESLLEASLPRFQSREWVDDISHPPHANTMLRSVRQGAGGIIRAAAAVDWQRRIIKSVLFTGDFFLSPARALYDLEACLKDARFEAAASHIERFFSTNRLETLSLGPDDFWQALKGCLDKCEYSAMGIPAGEADSIHLVGGGGLAEIAAAATVLLLPYCAKDPECHLRHQDGCDECGDCSVGAAYGLAGRYGLSPVTVQSYEHLVEVLRSCRQAGATSFIGCCCQAFLAKRYRTFSNSGLTGALVDISDTTCYELDQEDSAYQGRFENQTTLKIGLLEKVLAISTDKNIVIERPVV